YAGRAWRSWPTADTSRISRSPTKYARSLRHSSRRPDPNRFVNYVLDMDPLEEYLSERYWSEDDLPREVRADTARRGPSIQVSAEAGRLLALLVRALGAARVLEVGTLFGYSGI